MRASHASSGELDGLFATGETRVAGVVDELCRLRGRAGALADAPVDDDCAHEEGPVRL